MSANRIDAGSKGRYVCPRCSGTGIPVVYGLPDDSLVEAAARGEVEIGGCVIPGAVELFTCPRCRETWSIRSSDGSGPSD